MYDVNQLDIIGASICDLKCEYCFLHKDKSFNNYDKIVQKAWLDGSYVKNIKKVFKAIDNDPLKVRTLQIWGGESLISIKNLIEPMKELTTFLPNLTTVVIPTNWYQTDVDAVCQILSIMDERLSSPRGDGYDLDTLHFHLQLSIDGLPNTEIFEKGHKADWTAYKNNFDRLCYNLKQMDLKNICVHISISSTTNFKLWFKSFKTYEDLASFFNQCNKIVKYVKNEIKKIPNNKLWLNTELNIPHFALPHQLSVEEGIELTKITRLIDYVLYQENIEHGKYEHFVREFQGADTSWPIKVPNHECPEANQGTITVLPDGTIAFCPSGYMEHIPEYQQELLDKNMQIEYKDALLFSQHVLNPITTTEEELKQYQWYVLGGGIKDSYFSTIYYNFVMGQELALSRQIDYTYYLQPEKLLSHLQSISTIGECRRENLSYSHVNCLTDQNLMRAYFNGYCDFARNTRIADVETLLKERIEKEVSKND